MVACINSWVSECQHVHRNGIGVFDWGVFIRPSYGAKQRRAKAGERPLAKGIWAVSPGTVTKEAYRTKGRATRMLPHDGRP